MPVDIEDLDDNLFDKYLAIAQYLYEKELLETLVAFEAETGVGYNGTQLKVASVLEQSLDMFAKYREGKTEAQQKAEEDPFATLESGVCAMGEAVGQYDAKMNVTAVAWASVGADDFTAVCATADKKVTVVDKEGKVLAEIMGIVGAPVLSLDVSGPAGNQEVIACSMAGETVLMRLTRPPDGWGLQVVKTFKDHMKHINIGRFAPFPLGTECQPSMHFCTGSRDHTVKVYRRDEQGAFGLLGDIKLVGEATSVCWVSHSTLAAVSRDDHHLQYWDVQAEGQVCKLALRQKVNLNALQDNIVSFAVLSLAVSADLQFIAVCTDKSRLIILKTFEAYQVRNLYGATVDEYDVPTVAFSLDQTFVYTTSSIVGAVAAKLEETGRKAMVGRINIFELTTGTKVMDLHCHEKGVRCMARHPHGDTLLTGSFDKTVKFWE